MDGGAPGGTGPATPTPSSEPPRADRRSRRERRIAIAAVVVAAIVVAAVVVVHAELVANAPSSPPGPSVLAPLNATWTLAPGYYEDISFELRTGATISGGLFASEGMNVFLFNTSEYTAYSTSGASAPHQYASGNTTTLRIYQALPTGSWYLVIANANDALTSKITVTTEILATAAS